MTVEMLPPPHMASARVEDPPLLVGEGDGEGAFRDVGGPPSAAVRGLPATAAEWERCRGALRRAWEAYLGVDKYRERETREAAQGRAVEAHTRIAARGESQPVPEHRIEREEDHGGAKGTLLYLRTPAGEWSKCYLLVPDPPPANPAPAMVVFYYDVDLPVGRNMGGSHWREDREASQFARHLVRRGYVVLVQRWYFEAHSEQPTAGSLHERYLRAVERLRRTTPGLKGLGRVVLDAAACVDYLLTLPFVDASRIGCMGHSLGGKMALYASAFDERYRAVVSSEPGIGIPYSNWDDPWYLGPEVRDARFRFDHHQLLALIAPRPFLLIAGESSDGERSWRYLNTARDVYALYGRSDAIGMVNHRTGHTPTLEAVAAAYEWLDRQLGT